MSFSLYSSLVTRQPTITIIPNIQYKIQQNFDTLVAIDYTYPIRKSHQQGPHNSIQS